MRAGFCSVCQANVWLTPQDACVHGHGAENISGVYEPVQPTPQPAVADSAAPVAVAEDAPAEHSRGADETAETQNSDRLSGRITSIQGDSGYIDTAALPSTRIYFKVFHFRGSRPPEVGDEVSFELKHYDDGRPRPTRAHRIARLGEQYDEGMIPVVKREAPTSERILDWAWLGYMPRTLGDLAKLALDERWEFHDSPANPEKPLPILHHYLLHTFGRLVLEQKVVVTEDCRRAAFNTGLVDARYEPIYALFSPNDLAPPWKLDGFCVAGEGLGQAISRYFDPLPQPPHYFSNPADLLYDTSAGNPDIDWNHVVIERLGRYPTEFLRDHWPAGIDMLDSSTMSEKDAEAYWFRVGEAVKADDQLYRRIMNRVKDAVALSTKRAAWNFRTAVPEYYPKVKKVELLLPICLGPKERTDMALAVERTPSGRYLGHTMLPLDWAYLNARLVCRPDSDWLDARMIAQGRDEEGPSN